MKRILGILLASVMIVASFAIAVSAHAYDGAEATVTFDGKEYTAHVGDILHLVTTVDCGDAAWGGYVECVEGIVGFDPQILEITPAFTGKYGANDDQKQALLPFMHGKGSAVANIADSKIIYSAAYGDGYQFNGETEEMSLFLLVTAAGECELSHIITNIGSPGEEIILNSNPVAAVQPVIKHTLTVECTHIETEASTEPSTAKETEPATQPSTAKETEPATQPSTAKETEPATQPSTAKPTEPATQPASEKPAPTDQRIFLNVSNAGMNITKGFVMRIFTTESNYVDITGNVSADSDDVLVFDLGAAGVELEENKQYATSFVNEVGDATHNLLMDASCIGATAVYTGETYEDINNSDKQNNVAVWQDKDPEVLGPQLAVTSSGEVIGTACPKDTTPEEILTEFVNDMLDTATGESNQTAQELIDKIASALNLDEKAAEAAIEKSEKEVEWIPPAAIIGDANGDGILDILDVTEIQMHLAHLIKMSNTRMQVADVDKQEGMTILDGTYIQMFLANLPGVLGKK